MRYPLVQRGLIALVQVLVMGVWFSASAVVPALARQWHMSVGSAAWLTTPVQAGFVAGAIGSALLGLADRMRPHLLIAGCAAGAAGCTLVMALFADGPSAAVPLRFATGAFLAGVYPVGIKLMASWSRPAGRALAIGVLIGALTLGSALPHLIGGLWRLDWRAVLAASAAIAFAGAIMAGALPSGCLLRCRETAARTCASPRLSARWPNSTPDCLARSRPGAGPSSSEPSKDSRPRRVSGGSWRCASSSSPRRSIRVRCC